jgi:hypothetical protein
MRAVTGSSGITGNLRDLFAKLHDSFEHFRQVYGVKDKAGNITDDKQARNIYEQVVRQAFNLRGMQGALLMAFEGPKSYDGFLKQMAAQQALDPRAAELRYLPEVMKEMLPKQMSTILTLLGGVSPGATKVTAGSPLAIMNMALRFLTDFTSELGEFGKMHPEIMGKIGTLIGIMGIGGLGIAAGFAVTNVILLNRAIIAMGIAAGMSGVGAGSNPLARLLFGTATAGKAAFTGAGAGFLANGGAAVAAGRTGGLIAGMIALINPVTISVALGIAVIAALVWAFKNPATIGAWIGSIQYTFSTKIIPAFIAGMNMIIPAMGTWFKGLPGAMLTAMSHQLYGDSSNPASSDPNKPFNWATILKQNAAQQMADDYYRDHHAPIAPSTGAHNSHIGGKGGTGGTTNLTVHVNAPHADPHKVAAAVVKQVSRSLAFNLRAGGTSFNSPSLPAFAANGGLA